MPGFFDKIKERAEKASFEADRLRRLSQAQSTLRTMQRELDSKTVALGRQALALFDAETLEQPELLKTCQQELNPLRQRIADQEAKIEEIRQEKPPEAAILALYGHICPSCQIQLPAEAEFCPRCGSQAMDVAPPSTVTEEICSQCGARLTPGSLFCSNCGSPAKAAVPPSMRTCPSCQASIPVEAVFCPTCGASIAPPAQEMPPATKPAIAPDKIVCPICRALIPTEAVFCPECGSSITAPIAELASEETWLEAKEAVNRIICPNCQASIPAEAVFCPECGSSVTALAPEPASEEIPPEDVEMLREIICPNCDAPIPAEAIFCPECGTSVESPRVEAAEEEIVSDEERGFDEDQVRLLPEAEEIEDLPKEEKTTSHTICPFCQALIPAEAEFCPECGEPTASIPAKTE